MKSIIQHLRFPFSLLLMPVFFYTLLFFNNINYLNSFLLFILLHVLVYPASNGYNSYMDKDEDSIGGVKKPMQVSRNLFYVTIAFDILAISISLFINWKTVLGILVYIAISKLYSWRLIRLKKYPILGFLTVFVFQGTFICYVISWANNAEINFSHALIASFLFGGAYPITQVYQHKQDAKDNVKTISMLLGVHYTFLFCGLMFGIAVLLIYLKAIFLFNYILIFSVPTLVYFSYYFYLVLKDNTNANYVNTMRMSWITAISLLCCFVFVLINNRI